MGLLTTSIWTCAGFEGGIMRWQRKVMPMSLPGDVCEELIVNPMTAWRVGYPDFNLFPLLEVQVDRNRTPHPDWNPCMFTPTCAAWEAPFVGVLAWRGTNKLPWRIGNSSRHWREPIFLLRSSVLPGVQFGSLNVMCGVDKTWIPPWNYDEREHTYE